MTRRASRGGLALALIVLVGSAACDSPTEPVCPGAPGCPDPPVGTGSVVEGVDLAALFAAPSPAEIVSVRRETSGRAPSVAAVETVTTLDLGDRETVRVVAGLGASGDTAFVAAVRQPPRIVGDQRARPLLFVLSEGPDVDLGQALDVPPFRSDLDGEFVTVVMAYRGQRLRIEGRTFTSDVAADPYDRDADDLLALAAHVRASTGLDRSDASRLALVGWGRGGTVALLAAARGLAPTLLLTLGAPTDFFLPSVQADARRALTGQALSRLPEVAPVLTTSALAVREGTASIAEARLELLRRSPAPFVQSPPSIVAAHGGRDGVVPVAHGQALIEAVGTAEVLYLEIEEEGHASILTNGEIVSTVSNLVCQRVLASEPVCRG